MLRGRAEIGSGAGCLIPSCPCGRERSGMTIPGYDVPIQRAWPIETTVEWSAA